MAREHEGLLVVRVDVRAEDEDELNRWYDTEHIPDRLAVPGFRSAARFRSIEHPGRYLAVYELDDPSAVATPEYLGQPMSPWATSLMARWTSWERSVWERIPPVT
jgi:hypothetical protein